MPDAPARPTAAIVIPALNEEGNIGDLIAEIRDVIASCDLGVEIRRMCVVDNGSTDATAERACHAGAMVVPEPIRGYGRACFAGLTANDDVDILIYMDGDRAEVPAELPLILGPLLAGDADLVVGSRVLGQAEPGALSFPQRFGNGVAGKVIWWLYRVRITDLGPYRAIRRIDLLALEMQEMTYGWPTEMIARAARNGLRVQEVPVTCRRRATGESKVSGNLTASLKTGWRVFSIIFSVRRS
jgi:glycosyltransferase involved in cell wall biosynthesis